MKNVQLVGLLNYLSLLTFFDIPLNLFYKGLNAITGVGPFFWSTDSNNKFWMEVKR